MNWVVEGEGGGSDDAFTTLPLASLTTLCFLLVYKRLKTSLSLNLLSLNDTESLIKQTIHIVQVVNFQSDYQR